MIKNYYGTMAFVMAAIFAGSGHASEVYIEQAGDSSTFNITQQNGTNSVGSSSTPATFSGNNIAVDILQDGTLNTAAIAVTSGTDTTINYSATGSSNSLEIDIANSGNSLTVTKAGDSNRVTMCGTNTAGVAANNAVGCSTAVGATDTTNVIGITGDNNSVNLALMNNNASNTVTIGNDVASSGNAVNITQGAGLNAHTTGITINGDTNTVNINQQ
jgi:hypothetical protein